MIRIYCRQVDVGTAANVTAAPAHVTYESFDIEAPELEAWLRVAGVEWRYAERCVLGATPMPEQAEKGGEG